MTAPCYLSLASGERLAYHRFTPDDGARKASNGLGVVFCGGFKSDMNGSKAVFLDAWCRERDIPYLRFDYLGHGESDGDFLDGTIGAWADNVVTVLDELTEGPQLLVGSSLGGWLALLATLKRPERIAALCTIAAAPDFTETLIWDMLAEAEQAELLEAGHYALPNDYCNDPAAKPEPYIITRTLIEEAREHLLLTGDTPALDITCPVRLLHGMEDADVPPEISQRLMLAIASDDVQLTYQKNGDHRMSSPASLALITRTLEGLIKTVAD